MGLPVFDVDFQYQALIGGIPGAGRMTALGINPDVDTTTQPEDCWTGASLGVLNGIDHKFIPKPATAVSMEVVSSSANDTALGTGARSVVVTYLDTDYVSQVAVLALNGVTPVALPALVRRINGMVLADSVGTVGGNNIGNLSIRATGGLGATYAYMLAGNGIMHTSLFTTPAGVSYDVLGVLGCINRTDTSNRWATISLCIQGPGGRLIKGLFFSFSSDVPYLHQASGLPINTIAPRSDIWARCETVSANNTDVTGAHFGITRSKDLRG